MTLKKPGLYTNPATGRLAIRMVPVDEKTLTKAELKKREEVAKAIKRENPNMPMAKKMAIATATAKKVAEGLEDVASMGNRSLARIASTVGHPLSAAAKNELARRHIRNEATLRLDVNKASNDELKQYVKKSSTTIARSSSVHPDVMHTHDAAQKELKKRQKMQEEAEQIDEISRDLARRYIRKVADKTNTGELNTKQVMKRRPGVNLAGKKAYPGVAGEPRVRATESVTLDELSKKALGSYVNRSADDISHIQRDITSTGTQSPDYKNLSRMRRNRKAGIATAVKKLTKEETELDEVSSSTLLRYQVFSGKSAMQGGDKGDKRIAGQKMADEKLRKKHGNSSTARVAAGPARRESIEKE